MALKSPLQANQLLAGLQKREPHLHDLIRSIIGDLEEITVQVNTNTDAIKTITSGGTSGEGLDHGQVMRRISTKL